MAPWATSFPAVECSALPPPKHSGSAWEPGAPDTEPRAWDLGLAGGSASGCAWEWKAPGVWGGCPVLDTSSRSMAERLSQCMACDMPEVSCDLASLPLVGWCEALLGPTPWPVTAPSSPVKGPRGMQSGPDRWCA